jgi:hypothetical protein
VARSEGFQLGAAFHHLLHFGDSLRSVQMLGFVGVVSGPIRARSGMWPVNAASGLCAHAIRQQATGKQSAGGSQKVSLVHGEGVIAGRAGLALGNRFPHKYMDFRSTGGGAPVFISQPRVSLGLALGRELAPSSRMGLWRQRRKP